MKHIVRRRRAIKQGKRPVEYEEEVPIGRTDRRSVTVKMEEEEQEDLATVRYAQYQSALTYARKYEMERYGATLIPPEENRNQIKDVREPYIPRKRVQIPPVQSKAARIIEPLTAEEGDISDVPISRKKIRPEKQVKHEEELPRVYTRSAPRVESTPHINVKPQTITLPRGNLQSIAIDNVDYRYRNRLPNEAMIDNSSYSPSVEEVNNDRYEDVMIRCLRTMIKDRVSRSMSYMLDKVKHVKPTPPKQYGGEDDVKVFETWLADLLRWFRVTGITGDSKDQL